MLTERNAVRTTLLALLAVAVAGSFGPIAKAQSATPYRYFLCRLVPPRATFMQSMSPSEKAVMARHVAYWTEQSKRGEVALFGPVSDPAGAWGVLILRAASEAALQAEVDADPAITSGIGMRYEVLPFIRISLPTQFARDGG